ncbi:MAG: hypothetical protein CDV28_10452 [Candidatus Electronema aureum]|uniref:GDSL-like Lipase/Acylhydrolase family protein n=1 Tax=Candidatus Electronema aureum TaxID=2005002 RepID=A0A521G4B4_9BACT|nr:MAG: hypothetical protein CDV28_10452 [Candidatus Electronema aureum]
MIRKKIYWIVLAAIPVMTFLTIIAFGELYYRYASRGCIYQYDQEVGWVPKKSTHYSVVRPDAAGVNYNIVLSTDQHGFRSWGNIDTDKKKIFFIGDSFTGDPNMSDEDAYYDQVKKNLDVEIFAFGGGGYGTLQELIITKKYINIIRPDYFVLQFCSNDFSNNSFILEEKMIVRNQKNLRPYYGGDKIVYRDADVYRFLYANSYLFRGIDLSVQKMQFKIYKGYYPPQSLNDKEKTIKDTAEAERITQNLLKMMADSVPKETKLFTFTCSTSTSQEKEAWIRVTQKAGFISLPMVSEAVERSEKEGVVVRAADKAHWGSKGHHIAGKVLADELRKIMKDEK